MSLMIDIETQEQSMLTLLKVAFKKKGVVGLRIHQKL